MTETVTAREPAVEKFNRLLRIPKGVFAIGKIVDKDASGPYAGVRIGRTADGTMSADVTDGRRAILVSWTDEFMLPADEHTAIIPADLGLMAEKAIPAKGTPDELMVEVSMSDAHPDFEAKARAGEESVTVAGAEIDAEFPDIESVVPEYKPAPAKTNTAAVAPLGIDLLIGLLKAMKAVGVERVDLEVPTEPGRVVKFKGVTEEEGRRTVVGVQCPLRTDPAEETKAEDEPVLPGMESVNEQDVEAES